MTIGKGYISYSSKHKMEMCASDKRMRDKYLLYFICLRKDGVRGHNRIFTLKDGDKDGDIRGQAGTTLIG